MTDIHSDSAKFERKLLIILDHVRAGNIITAADLVKRLAIALDQRGYAKRLKDLLAGLPERPRDPRKCLEI